MACTLDSFALLSLEEAKDHLHLNADDLQQDAFSIYHDEGNSATACTVKVAANTLTIEVTGGAGAGTFTFDLTASANDTIGELVTAITGNVSIGANMVIVKSARDDVTSTDLVDVAAAGCFGASNVQTLRFTDNCELIELINIVSDVIEHAADRRFKQRTYTEWRESDEQGWVQVRNFPINWIDWVATSFVDVVKIKATITDAVTATVSVNHNPIQDSTQESHTDRLELIINGGANAGSNTVTLASGTNLTSVVASINALTGWEATVQDPAGGMSNVGNMPSDWLMEFGGVSCLDTDCFLRAPDEPTAWLMPEFRDGRFRIWCGRRKVWTKYTGGYATIPDDIKWLAIEILGELWERQSTGFSPDLKSETLGDYKYERADTQGSVTAAEAALSSRSARIERYRNVLY